MKQTKNPHDKILGCLIGGAIGDACGTTFENRHRPQISSLSPSSISDDTQLTMSCCEAIVASALVDPETIASFMLNWYKQGKLSGLGASTLKALNDLALGQHWALCGRKGEYAAGNGAAMRIAPIAFLLDPNSFADRIVIRDVSRITHHNEEAYVAALAIVFAIRRRLASPDEKGGLFLSEISNNLPDSRVNDRLIELSAHWPTLSITEAGEKCGVSAYAVDSIPFALYAASFSSDLSYEEIIMQVINAGGDCDTNASLAGQIIGAQIGYSHLPQHLCTKISDYPRMMHIFSNFVASIYPIASKIISV